MPVPCPSPHRNLQSPPPDGMAQIGDYWSHDRELCLGRSWLGAVYVATANSLVFISSSANTGREFHQLITSPGHHSPPSPHLYPEQYYWTRRMQPGRKLQLILGQRHNCLPDEWLSILSPQERTEETSTPWSAREKIIVDVHPKWLNRRLCRNGPCKCGARRKTKVATIKAHSSSCVLLFFLYVSRDRPQQLLEAHNKEIRNAWENIN